jgi:collagen type I/II/III/V/XI/XXIV/XXVII alpha
MPSLLAIDDADSASSAANNRPVACFAAGTWIATTRGHVAVETVHPGAWVCTVVHGDQAEVIWVGRRTVDCARHPEPTLVWPVRVSADAFGRGIPAADLFLSPNHAVYVDRVLIPVRLLVNGRTVRQVMTERISYHHIELARHDVLLANGMPAESYLDTGDRARFSNGGDVITLHPDFSARARETSGCATLVESGRILDTVRNRLATGGVRHRRRTRQAIAPAGSWPSQFSGPSDPWPR